jgi:hypothetical protein
MVVGVMPLNGGLKLITRLAKELMARVIIAKDQTRGATWAGEGL